MFAQIVVCGILATAIQEIKRNMENKNKTDYVAEIIANGIMIGVQANLCGRGLKEKKTMKTNDELYNIVNAILNEDYSNITYTSQLYEMLSKRDDAIKAYIKEGREFWYFDGEKRKYRKLKVTYVRSGVMFFVFEDEPDTEHAWFITSFNGCSLYAAQIYPYEIGRLLSQWIEGADEGFPKACKTCKWDDCGGKISVEVIWDN